MSTVSHGARAYYERQPVILIRADGTWECTHLIGSFLSDLGVVCEVSGPESILPDDGRVCGVRSRGSTRLRRLKDSAELAAALRALPTLDVATLDRAKGCDDD